MILSKVKNLSLLLLAIFILAACGKKKSAEVESTPEHEYTKSEHLLNPKDLNKLIESNADFVLIDCRKEEQWAESHIENAINIFRSEMTKTVDTISGLALDRADVAKILGDKGVKTGQDIVLYDDRAQCESVRFWWLLRSYGHSNVMVLDGGFQDWQARGYALETEVKKVDFEPFSFEFENETNTAKWANIEMVKRAIDEKDINIIDCRSKVEYTGEELKKGAFRAGHIPTSMHFDFWENMNMGPEGEIWFRSKNEIAEKYERLGLQKSDTIIVYCQSGVRSAQTTFVLTELLGYNNVYNYDGSWIEWSANTNLPIINEFETPKRSEKDPGEVI
ncbi:MAG: sulfurtransferase [Bacteroidia bacterium]